MRGKCELCGSVSNAFKADYRKSWRKKESDKELEFRANAEARGLLWEKGNRYAVKEKTPLCKKIADAIITR